ncbi:MAG: hypothetical protein ACRERR_08750 [Moraxellaceae bacterium]
MFKHILIAALMAGTATIAQANSATPAPQYDKPGYTAFTQDGRLWVFKADSKDLEEFQKSGEPVKQYTRIGEGPDGMTVKGASDEDLNAYLGK